MAQKAHFTASVKWQFARIFLCAYKFFLMRTRIFYYCKNFFKLFLVAGESPDPGLCYLDSGPEIVAIYVLQPLSSHVPR